MDFQKVPGFSLGLETLRTTRQRQALPHQARPRTQMFAVLQRAPSALVFFVLLINFLLENSFRLAGKWQRGFRDLPYTPSSVSPASNMSH